MKRLRGSRKHVLDWIDRPDFISDLRDLVQPAPVELDAGSSWMPRGTQSPAEARLESFGPAVYPDMEAWAALRSWWLVHERGANTPNWDIACSVVVEGRRGLVLVEAKANVPELDDAGKKRSKEASKRSIDNHDRIAAAIDEARTALDATLPGMRISRDHSYQLSNRIAFAWKLASLGLPTVLVYLGFTGDEGIADAGAPLRDDSHWQSLVRDHLSAVAPLTILERRIDCGAAPFWLLVRSRAVLERSPPRA